MSSPQRQCIIVVSTWGNPATWLDVDYEIGDVKVRSCTSLIPLLRFIERSGKVLRVYILGLDSIVDSGGGEGSVRNEIFRKCLESHGGKRGFSDYSELVDSATRLYECFIEELSRAREVEDLRGRTKVIVLPAVGSPGGRLVFRGSPDDYLAAALYRLSRELLGTNELGDCNRVSIVFDSTHGVNYMPLLTLKAVETLAELLQLKLGAQVAIEVYNTDPVTGRTDLPRRINKVYERVVRDIEIPLLKDEKLIDPEELKREANREEIGEYMKNFRNEISEDELLPEVKNVLSASYSPAPLALLYACNRLEDGQLLDKAYQLWLENIKVEGNEVKRLLTLHSDAVAAALYARTICDHVENLLASTPDSVLELSSGLEAYKLDLLKKLTDLYRRIHGGMHHIISRELSKLEKSKKLGKLSEKGCIPYSQLLEEEESQSEPDPRNLFAHAGLQHNLVDACLEDGGVYLRYYERMLEKTFEQLVNIYQKI